MHIYSIYCTNYDPGSQLEGPRSSLTTRSSWSSLSRGSFASAQREVVPIHADCNMHAWH
jgi:hypothetical protein